MCFFAGYVTSKPQQMKFSLCYTSRRAVCIRNVVDTWLRTAREPENVEVIVSVDQDYSEGLAVVNALATEGRVQVKVNEGPNTCVSGWNTAAAVATGDVLIAVADDFLPPNGWDYELKQVGEPEWWKKDRVVWVADGYNPDLLTLSILTRKRYRRFGYIFYTGYSSLFCDTEFTAVARSEGVVIDARHLLFEHLHPDCGKRVRDSLDVVHASKQRWNEGEMLFNLRRSTGFPLDAGPVADRLDASYSELKMAAYVQAIRDDLCLYEVIDQVLAEGNGDPQVPVGTGQIPAVYICSPDEYWGGKPQSDAERAEIDSIVQRLRVAWPNVAINHLVQPVAPHRIENRSRIMVETAVRNAAVDKIREDGYPHILILDGDEFWRKGLLSRLRACVQTYRPSSVYTGMTPVIGLPGYPVEGAEDKATIYIGPGVWFVDCRGVCGHRHELPSLDVIHFTATRRTREAIAAKMLESGHADDPNYDFKTWNEKVLPNIRPGFVHRFSPTSIGLHMYLPYNVWKSCREWRHEEIKMLPKSLLAYLALPPGSVTDS